MTENKFGLEYMVAKCREAQSNGHRVLSKNEQLMVAMVLNRSDWLAAMGCTMARAIDWIDPDWLPLLAKAERILTDE